MTADEILSIAASADEAHRMAQAAEVRTLIPLSGEDTLELCAKDLRERIRCMQSDLNSIEDALDERRVMRTAT